MQRNCIHFVQWRKIFPVPENVLQITCHKPFTHTLHKGHTHVHWWFSAEPVPHSNTEAYRVLNDYIGPLEILS